MATYREQLETLSGVRLRTDEHRRVDCPFCGGRKTLSLSNVDGAFLWHCYKASCDARGRKTLGRTADQIRGRLERQSRSRSRTTLPIPSPVSDPTMHSRVMQYLHDNGCVDAYENGWARIKYAPAEGRVLFYTNDRNGAVGRSLSGKTPKWKAYGDTTDVLTVGEGNTLVLVEDAASACSVARVDGYVGGALLGTTLTHRHRDQLRSYAAVTIALDKDASRKSLRMHSAIQGLVPSKVRLLSEDAKYMTIDQIWRTLS